MKRLLAELFNSNWFFLALVGFVAVLPLSEALVSIFAGIVLLTALIEDKWTIKRERTKSRKLLFLLPVIFLLYLLSTLLSLKYDRSFYDVNKVMFYLVFPVAFGMGKELTRPQKRTIFNVFSASVFLAIGIAIFRWKFKPGEGNFSVHNISLISHIRFSFQLILVIWFLVVFAVKNHESLKRKYLLALAALVLVYAGFLVFQQSLTGIVALAASGIFFLFYLIYQVKPRYQTLLIAGSAVMIVAPVIYIVSVVNNFYDFDQIEPPKIEKYTAEGNLYQNDFQNPMVENGHFVGLYVCKDEMRREWNKISEYKFDSLGLNGFTVSSTLVRYLTSKGLRKDAAGVKALSGRDISNIENGMANVIYQRKYSLYPRIYQSVWEYYVYSKTGNANQKSLSQRIEYAKAALTIIGKNPWLGVGTGRYKEEFGKAFKQNNPNLNEKYYASAHNQYLNYLVKFGIAGFLLIYFLILFPVVKTHRYRDVLFVLFLVLMFAANFADSNFESHMGSSFFVFFYCLFMSGDENYLKLSR